MMAPDNKPVITIIAAVDRNGVIGVNGDMPWRIPSDFAHFKRMTMGKPMIMGRKQFETVGKPLPASRCREEPILLFRASRDISRMG